MRISISLTNFSWPAGPQRLGHELTQLITAADRIGVDTVWVADHLIQGDPTAAPTERDMLEAYTTLGFIAAKTERVRVGAMVSSVTMRAPALLVKAVTTLDVLSGGRAWLGLGAGYHQEESRLMGLNLPPVVERFECLEDTLRLAAQMWAGDESPFTGKHYQLDGPHSVPVPICTPHPPVLVGGTGERRTLRLVAQYADACNVFDIPDGGKTVRHNLAVLARHCDDVGRPYSAIEKTLGARLHVGETSQEFIRRCATAAELGIDHVILITPGPWTMQALDVLAGAIPAVREITPP